MSKHLIILLLIPFSIMGKDTELNTLIRYSNENIHGMLIIHRMLENFNQELNAYVDLQSTQVNFYGNDDLPKDIFADPDHFFYDISPTELYEQLVSHYPENSEVRSIIDGMRSTTNALNQLRFTIHDLIKFTNLHQVQNQKAVYEELEKGVAFYSAYFSFHKKLEDYISSQVDAPKDPMLISFHRLHTGCVQALRGLRNKDEDQVSQGYRALNSAIKTLPDPGNSLQLSQITGLAQEFSNDIRSYLQNPKVTTPYIYHGYFYYYHNIRVINKFNRYGNGIVYQINEILQKRGGATFALEEPHYFKVIYPAKKEISPFVASQDSLVAEAPQELEKRTVVVNQQKIYVDNEQFEFQIFDHKDQDGDILSLNFNGDWVLDKFSLTNKPFPLQLLLNANGKNYLILHAENVGSRPPNTMAINYYYKGKKRQIILNSDLATSEMIEIVIDEDGVDMKASKE